MRPTIAQAPRTTSATTWWSAPWPVTIEPWSPSIRCLRGSAWAASLMTVTFFLSRRRGYLPVRSHFAGGARLARTFVDALWALSIPVFIIVGIRYGIFTPTEAGAITVLYTILVGVFAYRSLRISDLPKVMKETALDTSSVMIMICAASAFGFYLAWERIPPQLASWLVSLTSDPTTTAGRGLISDRSSRRRPRRRAAPPTTTTSSAASATSRPCSVAIACSSI